MEARIPSLWLGIVLRLGFFIFLALTGVFLFGWLLYPLAGTLIAAAVATFAGSFSASALAMLVFERLPVTALGLNWHPGWLRNFWIGTAGGAAAAVAVIGGPLLVGAATLQPVPANPGSLAAGLLVTVVLVFGAVGEEMLFRGYPFQLLAGRVGGVITLVLSSLLFGWAHMDNQNASSIGIANTVGFGVVLGYAFLRAGDLWLPIGIHFGWNWILPLFGVNLSGFTMKVTGYEVQWKVSSLWSGGAYGPEGSILTSAVIVLLLLFLYKARFETQTPPLLVERKQEL